MPASFSLFGNSTDNLSQTVGAAVERGFRASAGEVRVSFLGRGVANTVNNGITQGVGSVAMAGPEAVSTGRTVIERAVEAANERGDSILRSMTGKIANWADLLTNVALTGILAAAKSFGSRFENALLFIPRQIEAAAGKMLRAAENSGGVIGRLVTHYDARTGRYHGNFGNRMVTMGEGRGEGFLESLVARIREGIANLGHGITTALRTVARDAFGLLSGTLGATRAVFTSVIQVLSPILTGLASDVFTVAPLLLGLLALSGQVNAALWSGFKAIRSGIISLFAQVPAALSAGWGFLTSAGAHVWAAVAHGYDFVAHAVTGLLHSAGTFIAGVWKSVTGSASFMGGLGNIGGFLMRIFSTVFGVLESAVSSIYQFFVGLKQIGIAVAALGIFSKAVYEAAKSAMEFAKAAINLSATTGFSLAKSGSVLNNFRSVGLNADDAQKVAGRDPLLTAISSKVFGVGATPDAANFAEKYAGRYQQLMAQGFGGRLLASSMAQQFGMTSPDAMRVAMTDPAKLRDSQGYAQNLNTKLGLSPQALAAYAEEIPLVLGKVGAAFEAFKMKLAAVMLPTIERLLNSLTAAASGNADAIGKAIERVARWMFVTAPVMLANGLVTVVGMISGAVDSLVKFGQYIADNLPKFLGTAVDHIAGLMNGLAKAILTYGPKIGLAFGEIISNVAHTLSGWMRAFGTAIMDMQTDKNNPLRRIAIGIAGFFDSILSAAQGFFDAIASSQAIGIFAPALHQAAFQASKDISAMPSLQNKTMDWFDKSPAFGNAQNGLNSWADKLDKWGDDTANTILNTATNLSGSSAKILRNGAQAIAPDGGPNIGTIMGQKAADAMTPGLKWLKDNVQAPLDSANQAVLGFQKWIGTKESRDAQWQQDMLQGQENLLKAAQEQTSVIRQQGQQGASGVGTDRVAAWVLERVAKAQGQTLRASGAS